MKNYYLLFTALILFTGIALGQTKVTVEQSSGGQLLKVDGQPFMVNGMNWDYFPIGTNYSYSLWNQSDETIKSALDAEMSLLRNMGVNSVRMYTGVPAKWIQYIYENYGIYTMLNHSFGRYGLTVDGAWIANTDYSDPRVKELLIGEVTQLVKEYKDTPGLLMFLLGNENNYGLFWDGAETEDIPVEDRKSTVRARDMYKLFNQAVVEMKKVDTSHPIAICNGDLLFLEIIVAECPDVDILGTNMYRGASFGDAFARVKNEYGKPILFTEFGADAFNAIENVEDQNAQAQYMVSNWKEIYENGAGINSVGNSLGGYTFQFSDGWWKYGQTKNLDVHDNNASWSNGGYLSDYAEGENNMNEEWFGICAKGPTNSSGLYQLFPRAAYYALKKVHTYDVFAQGASKESLDEHFSQIQLVDAMTQARGDKAALAATQGGKLGISLMRAEFTTFATGGNLTSTPETADPNNLVYPNEQGVDHMQSYFIGVEAKPSESVRANIVYNILGNVALNPINEIFYENRGRPRTVVTQNGNIQVTDLNRVQMYSASYTWNHKYFDLTGFYRTGHYHWGYEGDFFGLYPEANYGPNLDIYGGLAPNGFEIAGKRKLSGLKMAFGPELWWGANPALLMKYTKELGKVELTGMFHEDLEGAAGILTSLAVPQPKTRRASLYAKTKVGKLGVEGGGIWAGQPLVGREFQIMQGDEVFVDEIDEADTWGGKVKLTFSAGKVNAYVQGAMMGLVARGGYDQTQTFTGWRLKDSGSGNLQNVFAGFTYQLGKLQIAPNFMYQEPIVDPIPASAIGADSPARLRNILDDPFAVRDNRETVAGEILFTYDLTPGTWMYEWDNDRAEDAKLAVSAGVVFRHFPTSMDAAIGFGPDRNLFAFPAAVPAADLLEYHARIVSKPTPDLGMIFGVYGGEAQPNGDSERIINRFGVDGRVIYKKVKFMTHVKVNDWGPFDYHRDFNLTFPLQLMADISTSVGKPDWFLLPGTQLGVRFMWRSLDQYSPRYAPALIDDGSGTLVLDPNFDPAGFDNGNEWELRTYLHINLGK